MMNDHKHVMQMMVADNLKVGYVPDAGKVAAFLPNNNIPYPAGKEFTT